MFKQFCTTSLLMLTAAALSQVSVLAQTTQPPATQSFDGEMLRDPTRPFAVTGISRGTVGDSPGSDRSLPTGGLTQSNFSVTFIRDGGASPMAVINEQAVTIGDLIAGATVVAISPDGVTLSVNGLEQVITTFGPTVKEVSGTEF